MRGGSWESFREGCRGGFGLHWREHRDRLGASETTFHSFRKYVATALDAAGLSAREIADYLGHSRPLMTQDVYMGHKATGSKAADALDRTIE